MAQVLLNLPATARPDEVIEVRTLIRHPMESGYRPDANGVLAPRDIIQHFSCAYDGEVVFSAVLSPAIAANPFISFAIRAVRSGPITFTWEGDNGFSHTETRQLTVA